MPEYPILSFRVQGSERETVTIRKYIQNMPFVYSIIWFINGSGSIIDTIKNLFIIAYSGKITLF